MPDTASRQEVGLGFQSPENWPPAVAPVQQTNEVIQGRATLGSAMPRPTRVRLPLPTEAVRINQVQPVIATIECMFLPIHGIWVHLVQIKNSETWVYSTPSGWREVPDYVLQSINAAAK